MLQFFRCMMNNICFVSSPVGVLEIQDDGACLTAVRFAPAGTAASAPNSHVARLAARQLQAYFAGTLTRFSVPLALAGTPFQQAVWRALLDIPYGQTRSYGQIAAAINRPRACRAVGMANNKNPICILVPCHRVIGAGGNLTGYAGGLTIKEWLLLHERATVKKSCK